MRNFFRDRVVKLRNQLPRKVKESLSLKVFKRHEDMAPGKWFSGELGSALLVVEYDDLRGHISPLSILKWEFH